MTSDNISDNLSVVQQEPMGLWAFNSHEVPPACDPVARDSGNWRSWSLTVYNLKPQTQTLNAKPTTVYDVWHVQNSEQLSQKPYNENSDRPNLIEPN